MDFVARMKEAISTGMDGSKDWLEKARDKVHDFGEASVIRLEIRQLESQAKQQFATLGTRVYEVLVDQGKGSVSQKTPELKEIFQEIEEIKEKIIEKEQQLPVEDESDTESKPDTGTENP